jgi:hypothetical protein
MTNSLQDARQRLTEVVVQDIRAGDGWFTESNEDVNDASRRLVAAMRETHGSCWLGIINRYSHHGDTERTPWIWEWDSSLLYNFGCSFVIPKPDGELVRLLRERYDAEYTGTAADSVRMDAIFDRIYALGGCYLTWT